MGRQRRQQRRLPAPRTTNDDKTVKLGLGKLTQVDLIMFRLPPGPDVLVLKVSQAARLQVSHARPNEELFDGPAAIGPRDADPTEFLQCSPVSGQTPFRRFGDRQAVIYLQPTPQRTCLMGDAATCLTSDDITQRRQERRRTAGSGREPTTNELSLDVLLSPMQERRRLKDRQRRIARTDLRSNP